MALRNVAVTVVCFVGLGCGRKGAESSSEWKLAAPMLALSSPVAAKTTTLQANLSQGLDAPDGGNPPPPEKLKSIKEQLAEFQARLDAKDEKTCLQNIRFVTYSGSPDCYGPTLAFLHHPNWNGPSGGGTMGCTVTGDGNGCLPSGDLGIWTATNQNSTEACTASKMNSDVRSVSGTVHTNISLMMGMLCVAKVKGQSVPEVGESIALESTLTQNIPDSQFTTAKVERLKDTTGGRSNWRFTIVGRVREASIQTTLTHSSNADQSEFAGRVFGYADIPEMNDPNGAKHRHGFSVTYALAGELFRYEARSAITSTSATVDQLFSEDGVYQYTVFAQGNGGPGNFSGQYQLAALERSSGLGTLYSAWQAGGGDSNTRVFQASTRNTSQGDVGFGYFGFGPRLNTATVGSIQGMWCNWAGPGALMHGPGSPTTYNSTKVQAQTMAREESTGLFKPVENRLAYAPTNSCDAVGTSFVYSSTVLTQAGLQAMSPANVVNNLVDYNDATIGVMPTLTSPSL